MSKRRTPGLKRIMIVGGPGAGKSTLAAMISERLQLPVVHMDHFFWRANWVQREREQVTMLAKAAADGEAWVFDGNHSRSWDYRAERADLIVVLLQSRWLRMWRILKRTIRHFGQTRPDMASGCQERFDREFWIWSWSYDAHSGAKLRAFAKKWRDQRRVVVLSSQEEVRRFLSFI